MLLQLIDNINPEHVLKPTCPDVSPKPNNLVSGRRSTVETFYKKFEELDVLEFNPVQCRVRYCYYLSESVCKAINLDRRLFGINFLNIYYNTF